VRLEDIVVSGTSVEIRTLTRGNALTNQVQQRLIDLRFLDPPVDGDFGPLSQLALQEFGKAIGITADLTLQPALARGLIESDADRLLPVVPKSNLAGRVFRYMARKGFYFARLPSHLNIVYVEGVTKSGTPNDNRPNVFNDRRMVFAIEAGVPTELGNWAATTEPGKGLHRDAPESPRGRADRIRAVQSLACRHPQCQQTERSRGARSSVRLGDLRGNPCPSSGRSISHGPKLS
jgi:peptidoglycan hydrolase-like protein with peptidoglycan-binding domain